MQTAKVVLILERQSDSVTFLQYYIRCSMLQLWALNLLPCILS